MSHMQTLLLKPFKSYFSVNNCLHKYFNNHIDIYKDSGKGIFIRKVSFHTKSWILYSFSIDFCFKFQVFQE